MSSFDLTIVTPTGCIYQGPTSRVTVRSTEGEITILGHHINYVTAIGMGPAVIEIDGKDRLACCIGGMLSMTNNTARLIASSFEWAEDIDVERAKAALKRAEDRIANNPNPSPSASMKNEAAKRRALTRISIAKSGQK